MFRLLNRIQHWLRVASMIIDMLIGPLEPEVVVVA